jgi:hypothetical protein
MRGADDGGRDRRYIQAMSDRPKHQRWIKRPPRPSRAAPPAERRVRPGMPQFLLSIGFGIGAGLLGAVIAPQVTQQPGMTGLIAGIGMAVGFIAMWRGFGGTREDVRALFR